MSNDILLFIVALSFPTPLTFWFDHEQKTQAMTIKERAEQLRVASAMHIEQDEDSIPALKLFKEKIKKSEGPKP